MYLIVVRITCNYLQVDRNKMISQGTPKYVKKFLSLEGVQIFEGYYIKDSMMPIGYLKVIY